MQQKLDRVHSAMFAWLLMFSAMRTMVPVNGRRLALYRAGGDGPAVVVLPGAGLVGLDFLSVAGGRGALVLYDRAGTGWSDPAELPRSAADVATELRELLREAAVPGPYVLVAHSIGALYARRFAQLFPAATAAMLLIDPGHEDLFAYLPPEAAEINDRMKPDPALLPDLTAGQLAAAREAYGKLLAAWPPAVREELIEHHLTNWRTALYESANLESEVYDEVRRGGPVPDVPVTVLTAGAGNPAWASHGTPEQVERTLTGIRTLHAEIAAHSTCGTHRVIEGATHQFLHIEHPAAVREALDALITAAASATH
jgi:pimeloyl-ACP methyl ester carboxylesterase